MRIEELEVVCQEAARNLLEREPRPLPVSVVLPLPAKTSVNTLASWPDSDAQRLGLLEQFADDVMRPHNAPCFGFVAEAVADSEDGPVDVVVVAFGARRNHPRISAAPVGHDGLGEFLPSEPLDPAAMPFLAALQHAADAATPPDAFGAPVSG